MARWVKPPSSEPPGPDREGWLTRIVKYVPTEIVAFSCIGAFFVATYLYIAFRTPGGKPKVAHYVISPFAFLAWAYPISAAMLGTFFLGFVAAGLQASAVIVRHGEPPAAPAAQSGHFVDART